jgi:YVTN family beta-propeller protein
MRNLPLAMLLPLIGLLLLLDQPDGIDSSVAGADDQSQADPSPVDVLLTPDESRLLVLNQGTGTLALVDAASGKLLDQAACGKRPSAVALSKDGAGAFVTATDSGELWRFEVTAAQLKPAGRAALGFHPRGVAISPDGAKAYVALEAANAVAVVDLEQMQCVRKIDVGRWPRYLALSPDGTRLAVGVNGDRGVAVVDTAAAKQLYLEEFRGINLGQMAVSSDGLYVYFPWMVYRQNPITARNIQLGWVLGSRIARVRLDGPAPREAITLDPRGLAISDPHGLALTPDGQWCVCAASGTQELLVYRLKDLPFIGYGGPGDHIDPGLLRDRERFFRISLGGRPMALCVSKDNRHVYVSNYLSNSVQVVDLQKREVARTIELGGPSEPSLARRGEAIFYDGRRSLDQWYSCHSCHYEGGTNAVTMDTMNDGTIRTFKTVLSLHNVTRTPPWTWHGWQQDLQGAMHKSLTETMLGPKPNEEDVKALVAWLDTLRPPPNPYRNADGSLSEAAQRGKLVFQSEKAGCANCHSGAYFTDGQVHDVGLGSPSDMYAGFNTPSLLNIHNRMVYLHNGRAKSLEEVLTDFHNPAKVTGNGELSEQERKDLIDYLKSL